MKTFTRLPLRSLVTTCLMLLATLSASAYEFEADGIYYNITSSDDLTVEVTYASLSGNSYSGKVTIPSTVTNDGTTYTVTSVGFRAFYDCTGLTGITFPESVTGLGSASFCNCSSLTSITFPENLTYIESSAFNGCSGLTSVSLPDGVTVLNDGLFAACANLASVTLPEGLTSINSGVFSYCTSLTSITLPATVTYIGSYAFSNCSQLSNVYSYCATPPTLQAGSFDDTSYSGAALHVLSGCAEAYKAATYWSNFTNIVEDITVLSFRADGIYYKVTDAENKTVEVTYKDTGYNSYSGDVTVPGEVTYGVTYSVTAVGPRAFRESSELKSVVLSEGITSIGANAFRFCSNMESVNIPDGVASIDSFAFYVCSSLTAIDIPNSVTTLGNNVFSRCTGLKKATVGNGITRIPNYFFNRCNSLTDVNIPSQVTSLGKGAFNQCYSLTTISIPGGVTDIGEIAFAECTALTDIYCYGTTPATLSSTSFDTSTYSSATLHVPEGSVDAYKAADYWSNFTTTVAYSSAVGISTPAELLAIADDLSGEYKLTADIDMNGTDFTPMGEFTGTLDGQGHVIKNLTYDSADTDNVGLFSTARGATVKNLGIQGARIVGNANVGGFIGRMYGGTITSCFLLDSYVEGSDHVGSILGYLDNNNGALSTMSDCASDSRVKTRNYQAGGMVGVMHGGTLERCLFTGTVEASSSTHVTGLVSLIDAAIYANTIQNNMLASAHVYGNANSLDLIVYKDRSVTVSNNYVLSSTFTNESGRKVGNLVYVSNGITVVSVNDATARSKSFYADTLAWDFDNTWTFAGGTEGCMYPVLQVMPTPLATRIYDVPTDTVLYADLSETLNLNLGHGSWGQELSYEITGGADLATLSDGVLTANSDAAGSGYVTVVASFPEAASAVLDPGSIEIKVLVDTSTGIGEVDSAADTAAAEPAYYSLDGRRLSAPRKGVNIVRLSDGTVKKVLIK